MGVVGYWLFPRSFMFGFSFDEGRFDLFLGVFAISIFKDKDQFMKE